MAVGRKTWTVLAHEPIEVLAPNVWRVEGRLNAYNRRVMTLVRLGDGRILIHNAIALDEPSMSRIDGWGEIVAILIPNGFHRQDDTVSIRELEGIGRREGVVITRSPDGVTAIFCDTLLNLPKLSGLLGAVLHPTGTLSVPRPTSLLFAKDKKALRTDLEHIAAEEELVRVIPGHGRVVTTDVEASLREAAARL